MISFGILLRKLEFSVAEFGIFALRKSGISFCGFWKKHLPFLDFQFAIIGKLTCGKQLHLPKTLWGLYVFIQKIPDSDIYSTLIDHEGKYECEAEDEMNVSDAIIVVGSSDMHQTIEKYKKELNDQDEDWIKGNNKLLRTQIDKAEQKCKYYENKPILFTSVKKVDWNYLQKLMRYDNFLLLSEEKRKSIDFEIPLDKGRFFQISPNRAYKITEPFQDHKSIRMAFDEFKKNQLEEPDYSKITSYEEKQPIQFWLRLLQFPRTLDNLLDLLMRHSNDVYEAMGFDTFDYWIAPEEMNV